MRDREGKVRLKRGSKWDEPSFRCSHGAHKFVQLAKWCRRLNIRYRVYILSKKRFEGARQALAQIGLPGIQGMLL